MQQASRPPVFLMEICKDIISEFTETIAAEYPDVAAQMPNVHVISQCLDGDPSRFSFGAWPLPEPRPEEYQTIPFYYRKDPFFVPVRQGHISIGLDGFGLVNNITVDGIPEMYWALAALKGYIGTPPGQST